MVKVRIRVTNKVSVWLGLGLGLGLGLTKTIVVHFKNHSCTLFKINVLCVHTS